jgi:hypothetical protein
VSQDGPCYGPAEDYLYASDGMEPPVVGTVVSLYIYKLKLPLRQNINYSNVLGMAPLMCPADVIRSCPCHVCGVRSQTPIARIIV